MALLEPIFEQFIQTEHPLVTPTAESVKLQRKAFYVGVWVALGLFKRSTKVAENQAVLLLKDINTEAKRVVYEEAKRSKQAGGLE